ncbi:HlyD family type I secretion periplasmic adaptor subunit [Acidisphaera rubrifaciens]|uniref:Membrane fusion protein (MFP) family protein n=1 Tax=Acidisphaera rubrifaciens HS-AP3 TaxID=1231350 RepID=A0A0D6P754_9PROT|nr:HlyD family type I secretion periplasmic adaptor subunit [Acidisphaera rubrifaciens]GAN76684.1 multidrug resistance efflux pump HlyD/EmrA/FusE [Acidisphaera rubrifaciens HS-AP3]
MPAILEFQSPSAAIIAAPVPRSARGIVWMVTALFASCVIAMGLIPVDKVVTAPGKVVSQAATIVVQPLDTAIVRSIDVHEGQVVRAGDILARLDPTFAAADVGALAAQVDSLQAEVSREQAEVEGKPFTYTGTDPNLSLQAAIFAQRASERSFKLETYQQKINGLAATVQRSLADAGAYRQRLAVAEQVEHMRKDLERLQVGSRLNSLQATDNKLEIQRGLENAVNTAESAKRDLAAMVAERDSYEGNWHAEVAQRLAESARKLSDAREQLNKAKLRRELVELRADRDATVLTIAKVSVGSVLQSGDQFITLVPLDAPLEVEGKIAGSDDGFVHVGDPVAIKFDTFPYSQYGLAYGTVKTISADSFTNADAQSGRGGRGGGMAVDPTSSETFYRARISLDQIKLHDTPAGFHLIPGMPITADIKVGKRTMLGYLLGRIMPVAHEAMREP